MLTTIKNIINGLALGVVSTIPGFSGGTIAIIMGFYFDLIEAINSFTKNFRRHLKLIVPLGLGAVVGVLFSSSLMNFLLNHYSFPTMLFLIGLIVGFIPHIYNRVKKEDRGLSFVDIIIMLIPFLVLVALSFIKKDMSTMNNEETLNNVSIPLMLLFLFAGIVVAAALVIPGLSGSFVLLLMGVYHFFIYSVSSIRVYLADPANLTLLFNICKVLIPLIIGIIIGGLSMSKLIGMLLKNHSRVVYTVILGLLAGSVFAIFMDPIVYKSGLSKIVIAVGIYTFCLGIVLSFTLGRKKL